MNGNSAATRESLIHYSSAGYGSVEQMVCKIDFDLAKQKLTERELDILNRMVYGCQPVADIGRHLGIGKGSVLREWSIIRARLAKHYGLKLK